METKLQIVACGFFIAYTTFKFRRLKHTHFLREKCWWKFHSCLLFHLINHESVKWWHFEKTSSQSYSSVDKNDSCHTIGNGAINDHFPILAHFWRENSNSIFFGVIFHHFENHSNQSHDFLKLISYFLIGKPAKNSLVGRVLKNSNYKQGQKYFVEWWLRLHHQRWFYNGMRQKTAQDTIRI